MSSGQKFTAETVGEPAKMVSRFGREFYPRRIYALIPLVRYLARYYEVLITDGFVRTMGTRGSALSANFNFAEATDKLTRRD